jgi:hypothetical protein
MSIVVLLTIDELAECSVVDSCGTVNDTNTLHDNYI